MADRSRLDDINDIWAKYVVSPKLIHDFMEDRREGGEAGPALSVIIELNLDFPRGRQAAVKQVSKVLKAMGDDGQKVPFDARGSRHHIFAKLTFDQLGRLLEEDAAAKAPAIFKVWPDRPLEPYLNRSVPTIKADACLRSFGSEGADIVWAVADSGIDEDHPHFRAHDNLSRSVKDAPPAAGARAAAKGELKHKDFTGGNAPLTDIYGHGTHVAGIIAGATPRSFIGTDGVLANVYKVTRERDEAARVRQHLRPCHTPFQGVAPKAGLLSLKVLDDDGKGMESALLSALDYVARTNDDGRWIRIHGVNISLGYPFEAEWFATGQSPLCVAVNRLVKQGVVVVVAAGNDGSALIKPELASMSRRYGLDQSISDPGNAEFAITVGSTHPEQPHTYGVSYFSSRGPTVDGRDKPDLVAPGERIISCASAGFLAKLGADPLFVAELKAAGLPAPQAGDGPERVYYREQSGTSMAAPHVSGAIAAFLSVRREFVGQPERVKEIFLGSATDLRRRREFQGAGLVDLMRALQSV